MSKLPEVVARWHDVPGARVGPAEFPETVFSDMSVL